VHARLFRYDNFMMKIDAEALRLDNQLCFALYASSRAMTSAYRPLLDALGLTYPQYLVLLALWESDELSVSSLGERLFLDSGTLTPLLKRMEKRGLVRRMRNIADEREVIVGLTIEGRRLKSRAATIPEQMICKVQFSRDRAIALRSEIRALLEKLKRPIADDDAAVPVSHSATAGHAAARKATAP
jgi:DNA-binding MarR family transcriptional regulator